MVDIKSTSNAVWWIKNPKEHERRTTLCQDMTDLFRNISMHGYNKLLETELFLYEKLIWFCLHVTTLAVVITILSYTWDQFVLQYFALNLHDPLYPIENMPFPGVSICSNNRISRQAAERYAYEL
ncbi:uncharacterized protein LOC111683476 [Lucilia cuprina]|nr:uncharacterized protein LOC111683476 [Lucilia cuprina]